MTTRRRHKLSSRAAIALCALLPLAVLTATARAVIVNGDDSLSASDPANVAAYSNFNYWSHVGTVRNGTGIYLDNGWVLVPSHITLGDLVLHGQTYTRDTSTPTVQLHNPDTSLTDLRLFKILDPPSLAPMVISSADVMIGNTVLMAGTGYGRDASATTWDVDFGQNPWVWTTPATPPANNDITGYLTPNARDLRWGDNIISEDTSLFAPDGPAVEVFKTRFNSAGTTYEAHAVTGDSGGPVWRQNAGEWELAGVIVAVTVQSGQPDGPRSGMLEWSDTYSADMALYRSQIMATIFEAAIIGDTNDDKAVNNLDIAPFILAITDPTGYVAAYPQVDFLGTADINSDGLVNNLDIAPFISLLTGAGAASGFAVPEPASAMCLLLLAASALGRRRKPAGRA